MREIIRKVKNIGNGHNVAIANKFISLASAGVSATSEMRNLSNFAACELAVVETKRSSKIAIGEIHSLIDATFQPRWNKVSMTKLAEEMGGIADRSRSTLKKMKAYGFSRATCPIPAQLDELIEINFLAARKLEEMIQMMKKGEIDTERVLRLSQEISELETRSDDARSNGLSNLVNLAREDKIHFTDYDGWKEVLRHLEEATDAASESALLFLSLARE